MSTRMEFKWFQNSIDPECCRPPVEATITEIIEKFHDLVLFDKRLKLHELLMLSAYQASSCNLLEKRCASISAKLKVLAIRKKIGWERGSIQTWE